MELPVSDKVRLFIVIMGFLFIVIILVFVIRLMQRSNPKTYTLRNKGKRILSRNMLQEQKISESQFEAMKNSITMSMNIRNIVRRLITELTSLAQLYEKKNIFAEPDLDDLVAIKKKLDTEIKNLQQFLEIKSNYLSPSSKLLVDRINLIEIEYIKIIENFLERSKKNNRITQYLAVCVEEVREKQQYLGKIHENLVQEFQQFNIES